MDFNIIFHSWLGGGPEPREALKVLKSCKIRDKVHKTCLFM